MKILFNKKNFFKIFVIDKSLEESAAILCAAQEFYKPLSASVQIEDNFILIDLRAMTIPLNYKDLSMPADTISRVSLINAIPILEMLVREDARNKIYIENLFAAYDLRGDFDIVLDNIFK